MKGEGMSKSERKAMTTKISKSEHCCMPQHLIPGLRDYDAGLCDCTGLIVRLRCLIVRLRWPDTAGSKPGKKQAPEEKKVPARTPVA